MKKLTPYEAYTLAKNLFEQDGKKRLVWLIVPKNGNYPYCQVTNEYDMLMENKDFSSELLEIIENTGYIMDNVGDV